MLDPNRGRAVLATVLLGGLTWAVASAAPAHAHVTVSPSTAAAGSSTVLTFGFSHGCEGSPTTALAVQLPEQLLSATPTITPGWEVEKTMAELSSPVTDSHGNQVTERVETIEYRAESPVPDGYRQTFEIQLTVPEDAAGQTLAFPAVQTCEDGSTSWIQVPADGQDPHSLDTPAPTLTVTAAEEGTGHGQTPAEPDGEASTRASVESGSGGSGDALGIAGLVAGLAGLVAGTTALLRGSRSRS
ncbi:DUF1775 domain-containing protein [Auraticoccus sp. F435]|uniref:DUF1775 domain-containing protein n=1 Tax=Auraticoccus cholistanensis TaxID=2656650 RepID=A0A6A9UQ99_9ACTN|nr:YcnI family protein [Auraticoccus cholistanensis]MVA74851.1 DUF1775 domain-containing protein [Auraticoccus cholistanensis]